MVAGLDASITAYTLAFQDGATLVEQGTGVVVAWAGHNLPVRRGSPGLTAALAALAAGGATEAAMAATVTAQDGEDGLPVLYFYLERFQQLGLLTYGLRDQASLLATLVPHARFAAGPQMPAVVPGTPDPDARYVLSRFACLRREADRLVLESALAPGSVVIHDPRAAALCQTLAQPRTVAELSEGASLEATVLLLGLLLGCRAATLEGPDGQDHSEALAMWSFHDLMLHIRSRSGRAAEPVGATFPQAGRIEPYPAVKPRMQGSRIELYRPDVEALKAHDVPLTRVLEERRSVRAHGERPIHVREIGELFYRAARVRAFARSSGAHVYPTTSRPYPGGGACYELELYLAVRACEGLAPGLYHYEASDHTLTTLSARTPAVNALLSAARSAMLAKVEPQTLLVVAARFARVMWKYESMAYALVLKDVGVLYQTLYLVATAMGLAPCAVGTGDSDLFARAAGLDTYAETSVGEFALGTRAEG